MFLFGGGEPRSWVSFFESKGHPIFLSNVAPLLIKFRLIVDKSPVPFFSDF